MTTDDRTAEAYELGCSRGWDHANFVDAYGKEHDRRDPDYPAWLAIETFPTAYGNGIRRPGDKPMTDEFHAQRAEFKRGWSDGRKRFHRGQYPDGTKIAD